MSARSWIEPTKIGKPLTKNEEKAIAAWSECDREYCIISFKSVHERSGLDLRLVRRTVRNMARKGVAMYVRGTWDDDGEPCGSGYGLTDYGFDLLESKIAAEHEGDQS